MLKSGSMYSTIGSGTASQATPQGRRHKRAEVSFELAKDMIQGNYIHLETWTILMCPNISDI